MSGFVKAERRQAKLKLAITGPTGAGKTYSALRLAKGLGGRIAVIDTENRSASLYADRFEFDVLEISAPYTNEKYLQAIADAVAAKYDVLIIDSLSHQWAGEGGLLNKKEQMDARGGNSFANWAKMTPEHEKFKAAILHADIHVIGTLRSKMAYEISQNDKGKATPQKIGLAPIQRDGLEYDFTIVFDVAANHEAEASKDRTSLFVGKLFQITETTGQTIKNWLESAAPIATAPTAQPVSMAATRGAELAKALNTTNWPSGTVAEFCRLAYNKASLSAMTEAEFVDLLTRVRQQTAMQARSQVKALLAAKPAEAVKSEEPAWTPPADTQGPIPQPRTADTPQVIDEPGSLG